MLAIEVAQLNATRTMLEQALAERGARDNPDIARVLDLLYGASAIAEDLGVVTRVALWYERNPPLTAAPHGRVERVDSTIVDFLRALARYLPDRIVVARRGEAPWFAFELPQTVLSMGEIPRVPPPHQWFIHADRVNAILKTYGRQPTADQVRHDAHTWLRSEAYRIKRSVSLPG